MMEKQVQRTANHSVIEYIYEGHIEPYRNWEIGEKDLILHKPAKITSYPNTSS